MNAEHDEIERIMVSDGDNCSMCRRPFAHGETILGGHTRDGTAALAGKCCQDQIETISTVGFYLKHN
jgi:hypothetical protein